LLDEIQTAVVACTWTEINTFVDYQLDAFV